MKINKLLGLAVALAAVSSLSAAIDADIAGKNGVVLKQYAQVLKNRAGQPHHGALAGSDTDQLLQDAHAATGNCDVYIPAELARAKARGIAALTALGADGANLLAAARAPAGGLGAHQPAGVTVGHMKAAFNAAFDAAVGAGGANVAAAEPLGTSHRQIQVAIDAVDVALQGVVQPWLTSLHAAGLAQANVFDAGTRAAILGVIDPAGALGIVDTLQAFSDYMQAALITH